MDLEQGREQGLEQGRERGERKILLRQLQRRFGDLPEPIVARLDGATVEDLERWADLILHADTLEDVFA